MHPIYTVHCELTTSTQREYTASRVHGTLSFARQIALYSVTAVGMGIFNCVYLRTLSVFLVCSSLSVASGKESHPVLKCNSYADAEGRGWEFSCDRESPFVLQVTRITRTEENIHEIGFQYRGRFNSASVIVTYISYLVKSFEDELDDPVIVMSS